MAEESSFVNPVEYSDIFTYFYQEENLKFSPSFEVLTEYKKEMYWEQFRTQIDLQNKSVPKRGMDFGDVKQYSYSDLKQLTGDFSKQSLIQSTHSGRLFRAKIGGGDGFEGHEVTIKTWNFLFPMRWDYSIYPCRHYNELALLPTEEMRSHKSLVKVIGFSCDKVLSVIYDLQSQQCVRDTIPSDTFDWDARMTVAIQIARLVEAMHDKKVAIGSIHARNIMIDKEGNAQLFEIGLHVRERGTSTRHVSDYFIGSYAYFAPEVISGTFHIKADTYAYGILLLELISKQVFDNRQPHDLKKRALDTLATGKCSLVDASFALDDVIGLKITNVAVSCLHQDPAERPEMGEVANELDILYGFLLLRPIKKPKTGDRQGKE